MLALVLSLWFGCESADRMEETKLKLHRIMRTSDNVGVPLLVSSTTNVGVKTGIGNDIVSLMLIDWRHET